MDTGDLLISGKGLSVWGAVAAGIRPRRQQNHDERHSPDERVRSRIKR